MKVRRFARSDQSESAPPKDAPAVTGRRHSATRQPPYPFAVMSTDLIAESPNVWTGHGIGWAMPFPSMFKRHTTSQEPTKETKWKSVGSF